MLVDSQLVTGSASGDRPKNRSASMTLVSLKRFHTLRSTRVSSLKRSQVGNARASSRGPSSSNAPSLRSLCRYAPAPPPPAPPTRWGTESGLRELLGAGTRSLELRQRVVTEHFRSIDHALAIFQEHFGPVRLAFEALDGAGREGLRRDLGALFQRINSANDGSLALPFEYSGRRESAGHRGRKDRDA